MSSDDTVLLMVPVESRDGDTEAEAEERALREFEARHGIMLPRGRGFRTRGDGPEAIAEARRAFPDATLAWVTPRWRVPLIGERRPGWWRWS